MRFFLVYAVVAAAACSGKTGKKEPTREACTALGQQCEVSPGKLGSCVMRDNCTGKNCFVCQSQH